MEPLIACRALTSIGACRSSIVRTAAQHVPRGCVPSAQLLLSAWTGHSDAMAQHALPFYEMALSVDAGHLQQSVGAATICTASSNACACAAPSVRRFGRLRAARRQARPSQRKAQRLEAAAAGHRPAWTQ